MKKIIDNNKCTGCTACMNICPKKAISMKIGKDGFKYPVIDQDKCIDCGLCKKVCPVLNTKKNESLNKCYVAYNKDENSRMSRSSSGGIFELIAKKVLENKGIVIGASFDKDNKLTHIAIEKVEDLEKLKGSKYIQSDLDNIFNYVKEYISNKKILFVGTPCQVAGLKSFLKKDYDNLICIDLICHGVPSPKLFNKYIKELEKTYNDKVINYNFRDKCTGWDTYSNTIIFKNNQISQRNKDNDFMKLFLSNIALRSSCYNCNFKLGNKYSDITLGDFWGVKNYYPKMYDNKGVSAVVINTKAGEKTFEDIRNDVVFNECKIEEILAYNPCLKTSCKYLNKRGKFFDEMDNYSIKNLVKRYARKPFYLRVITKIKHVIKKLLRK